jgi:hypothetical protein
MVLRYGKSRDRQIRLRATMVLEFVVVRMLRRGARRQLSRFGRDLRVLKIRSCRNRRD